jgi:hypothetical protein
MPNTEKIPFTLHSRAIRFLVTHQSGSVQKAVLEAVMNSIDAGANRIDVKVEFDSIEITDNGKGFASRQEILDCFAAFCAPHIEGDARYGRFRMGRGQLFNLGPNTWLSGKFRMDVDFTVNDTDDYSFNLDTVADPIEGTRIGIKLKEALNVSSMMAITDELKKFVAWAEAAVFVNGDRVSNQRQEVKWDLETETFFLKLSNSEVRGLDVYNLGVLVCNIPRHKFGISGAVISKQAVDCNFARNEILPGCKVFKRISAKIKDFAGIEITKKKKPIDPQERTFMARRLVEGALTWDECKGTKLFKDTNGRGYTPRDLAGAAWRGWRHIDKRLVFSFAPAGNFQADNLLQSRQALVLDLEMLEMFGVTNPAKFMQKIRIDYPESFVFVPFKELSKSISDAHHILSFNKYTEKEQLMLAALARGAENIASLVYKALHPGADSYAYHKTIRKLCIGVSETADGWTDGQSYIALNRAFIQQAGASETGFCRLLLLALHEYCHGEDDRETHVHGLEFYAMYEELSDKAVAKAGVVYKQYVQCLTNAAKRLTKKQEKMLLTVQAAQRAENIIPAA